MDGAGPGVTPAAVPWARGVAVVSSVGLLVLWGRFVWTLSGGAASGGGPGTEVTTGLGAGGPPLWLAAGIFGSLALAGGVAALRNAPLVVALAGGLSFIPSGLFLLTVPGIPRWIGLLDLALLGAGAVLTAAALRRPPVDRRREGDVSSATG